MNYLVIGGCGFIGSKIALLASRQRHSVVILDKNRIYNPALCDYEVRLLDSRLQHLEGIGSLVHGSACDLKLVAKIINDHNIDCVIHAAGTPLLKFAQNHSDEANSDIFNSVKQTLLATTGSGVKRFVFLSSSTVYGDFRNGEASEENPLNAFGLYALLKKQAEEYVQMFCEHSGLPYTIIRPTAVYGWGDVNPRVIQTMVRDAFKKSVITVIGENESLDFTHVDDLAMGVLTASRHERARNEILNLSKGEARSLLDLGQYIALHREGVDIQIVDRDDNIPKRGSLNISKARRLIGYDPTISLLNGIKSYITSYMAATEITHAKI